MKQSEKSLLKKIFLFLFGLTNIIPSEISIYDRYVIPLIESSTTRDNPLFVGITIGIVLIRIFIILGTFYELYNIYKYNKHYKIIGYK